MTEQSDEIRTVTYKTGKLLYGFSFTRFCLLDYSRFEGPPPLIFACIGFNFITTSKEKQKVILQKISELLQLILECPKTDQQLDIQTTALIIGILFQTNSLKFHPDKMCRKSEAGTAHSVILLL